MFLECPWVSMVFPQFFLSWGPNQPHVQRQEGRDVLPAAVGHEASGASDIVMYKMSHTPIYIYILCILCVYKKYITLYIYMYIYYIYIYIYIYLYPPPLRGVGGKNRNIQKGGCNPPHTPRNMSAKYFWFICGRIRQWKILALSVVHQRAPGGVVRYVQTGWSSHFHVSSPQIVFVIFLRGGGAKPWYFSALEAPPGTNSIATIGLRFWISSKTRSRSSQRSCAVCFFDLCISNWHI